MSAHSSESMQVMWLGPDSIRPFCGQPRTDFDPARLAELAASIQEHGQQVPIIVRELAEPDGEVRYEIIDGERRWHACQIAHVAKIRAIIGGAANTDQQFVQSVVANFGREDHTPHETLIAVSRVCGMPEYRGLSVSERDRRVGNLFARSESWVASQRKIFDLPVEVRDLIQGPKGERLNSQLAILISGIDNADAQIIVARKIVDQKMSPAKARATIHNATRKHGRSSNTRERSAGDEATIIFRRLSRVKEDAELALEMPMSELRRYYGSRPLDRETVIGRINDALSALEQIRDAISLVRAK